MDFKRLATDMSVRPTYRDHKASNNHVRPVLLSKFNKFDKKINTADISGLVQYRNKYRISK